MRHKKAFKNRLFEYPIMLSMLVLSSAKQITVNQSLVEKAEIQTIYGGKQGSYKHCKMIIRYDSLIPVVEDIPEEELLWDRLLCFMDQIRRIGSKSPGKIDL